MKYGLLYLAVSLAILWPVLLGYVPLPVEIATNTPLWALLVYSDADYPGWRAFVDGVEVPILLADHAFKAVRVDPGTHHVRFAFDPPSFRQGVTLTLLGLAILAGLLGWSAVRRKQAPAA